METKHDHIFESNNMTTPGATFNHNQNGMSINYDEPEKLLQDFHQQLQDHKKKTYNIIQNLTESNHKFDEVKEYFMSKIGPSLKQTAHQYREQNKLLMEEIQTLKLQKYVHHSSKT